MCFGCVINGGELACGVDTSSPILRYVIAIS